MTNPLEWTAFGAVLFVFVSGGVWLFKSYLPQQRTDFLSGLDRQRQDAVKSLTELLVQFKTELAAERDLHKSVQQAQLESHQREVEEMKLEILALSKEIHTLSVQYGNFMAIWVSLQGLGAENVELFFTRLREMNGK